MDLSATFGKLLVVSPHLDDAVFSCGELIARHSSALVVTVFSAAPAGFDQLTDWDAASGFLGAEEAVSLRKQEDYAALHLLSALPQWLDFFDSQYQATPSVLAVASALQETIQNNQPDTIVFPAGLFHSDHLLVHQAVLSLRRDHPEKNWVIYEDALYRRLTGAVQRRLVELSQARIDATPMTVCDDASQHMKRQAVHCYASQLQALSRIHPDNCSDAFAPERLWRLTSAPIAVSEVGAHA